MSAQVRFWCIVPAGGRGSRFGGDIPKQHVLIAGRSLLLWTLATLAAHPRIAGLIVVVAAGDTLWEPPINLDGVPILTAIGGAERADSVIAGISALPAGIAADDFVLVHDAARPCVRAADIDALIHAAVAGDGGLLAAPLRDTLKRADGEGRVVETESRESRWRALTPQMFRHDALLTALVDARAAGVIVTDESMAMERAGYRPVLVEGSEDNLKVTTATDRDVAEILLTRRAR